MTEPPDLAPKPTINNHSLTDSRRAIPGNSEDSTPAGPPTPMEADVPKTVDLAVVQEKKPRRQGRPAGNGRAREDANDSETDWGDDEDEFGVPLRGSGTTSIYLMAP
jgi:hypothetical protein